MKQPYYLAICVLEQLAGGLRELSYTDCSSGLKVKPQKGKVIIFYSLDASGARDPSSLHGACPVGEGNVKWAANKWIWNAPMGYVQ
jgi:prolyl 4-hydroxylase